MASNLFKPEGDLKDDETRLARWSNLTPAERGAARSKEMATLKEAEKNRKQPLSSKLKIGGMSLLRNDSARRIKENVRNDAGDREGRYVNAREAANTSEADRERNKLYGTSDGRAVKLKDNEMVDQLGQKDFDAIRSPNHRPSVRKPPKTAREAVDQGVADADEDAARKVKK